MYLVSGTTIILTKGNSFYATVGIYVKATGEQYVLQEGDSVKFELKRKPCEDVPLVEKIIPTDTLELKLDPNDTSLLPFGDYFYDMTITFANGDVDTFIDNAKFILK